jgi:hypothetical protein
MNKKSIILFSIVLLVLSTGCNLMTGKSVLEFSQIENVFIAMEDSFNERDFKTFSSLFNDKDYAFILRDLFFRQEDNVTLYYGFPDDEYLKKPLITTKDLDYTIPGRIKYVDENTALTAIKVKTERLNLFTGVVLQKFDNKWKITRLYDFVVFEDKMMEVGNFYLDFFKSQFNISLVLSENIRNQGLQTTFLYNTYLLIDKIDIDYHNQTLCSFSKEDITMKVRSQIISPDPDNLYMVDEFNIDGKCSYGIVSPNLEQKYLLDIVFYLKNGIIMHGYYYGDLRL